MAVRSKLIWAGEFWPAPSVATSIQRQQYPGREQAFERMLKKLFFLGARHTGGLLRSALEKALTMSRIRNTISRTLAMPAASPASPKKPR